MATYQRHPAITVETYQRMIESGLKDRKAGIISVTVPARFAATLTEHFNKSYKVALQAASRPGFVRMTVWGMEMPCA